VNGAEEHCHVTRYTGYEYQGELQVQSKEDLGVMRWDDLAAQVTEAGGERVTYDLFNIWTDEQGSFIRYHAMDVSGGS
jgi:hypothetical protein